MKQAKVTDSVSMKALIFLEEGRVIYPENINHDAKEIVIEVYGLHSGSIIDPEKNDPYIVTLRKNGEHSCSCDNASYRDKNEYRQFWGDRPIRASPECSHVLAAKLHPLYFEWISDGKKKKKDAIIRSKISTGKRKLETKYFLKNTIYKSRKRKNVEISEWIKNKNILT